MVFTEPGYEWANGLAWPTTVPCVVDQLTPAGKAALRYPGRAECAHAVFAGARAVTPKTRNGIIEYLRVLEVCRKTALAARRVALRLIQNTIVCAPDELREPQRAMTCMQLIRTLAAWRLSHYRNPTSAYRIALKSLGRRYLELHDEVADLNVMIAALVDELAPERSLQAQAARQIQMPPMPRTQQSTVLAGNSNAIPNARSGAA